MPDNVTRITPEMADWMEELCGWRPPVPIASAIKPRGKPRKPRNPNAPRDKDGWNEHLAVVSLNRDLR